MFTITAKEYTNILNKCFDTKTPLYVYGPPGIGKSVIPRQTFSERVKNTSRTYLEWTNITLDEKKKCIEHPEKYFILCDQRIANYDPTDLKGIPNMLNGNMLETIPLSWVVYFTQKNAAGVIFFDEMNLATPAVSGAAYQIIHDRSIADRRLADDVWVLGAGNRAGIDNCNAYEMPFPLRDRFNEVELRPDINSWNVWAAKNINPHLIAFVNWKESYLFSAAMTERKNHNCSDKDSTPRGIERASKMIEGEDITNDITQMYVSMAVGDAFASQFKAYVTCFSELNWDTIFAKPSNVKTFKSDKLWAILGGLAEMFNKMEPKDNKTFFNIVKVLKEMTEEYSLIGFFMLRQQNPEKFQLNLKKMNISNEEAEKFIKFII